jgi:hypothetical protein
MMMVATGRDEGRLGSKALLQFEAEYIAIKFKGALQVGNFQVDMADADARIDRLAFVAHDRQYTGTCNGGKGQRP